MKKFLFSSILQEIYREILFITYHYNDEYLSIKDINKLGDKDFSNLKKSKQLSKYYLEISTLDTSPFIIDYKVLDILRNANYNKNTLTYLVEYINPYLKFYYDTMKSIIDKVSEVADIKMKSKGYDGDYPLYIMIKEKEAIITRAIIGTNTMSYINKETTKFGFKITFLEYKVKLIDYKYNDIDLRNKTKEEIYKIMDDSLKVNLNNTIYYDTSIFEFDIDEDEIINLDKAKLSLFLDKKNITYSGLKDGLKLGLKRGLISLIIIIVITILFLIFKKYF